MKARDRKHTPGPGSVRITAGEWRGRRVPVPDLAGLRPSGDRGREVLFNWLQPHLRGKHCVDLFAGTGVLGLESVSRGAATAVLVENNRVAVAAMRQSLERLQAEQVTLVESDAISWLESQVTHSCDIVFIDPPFGLGLAQVAMQLLNKMDMVRPRGLVYVESARSEPVLVAGPGWEIFKEKLVGEVRMQVFKKIE